MGEHKVGALMLTQGTSLVYFTNIHWGGGERLTACVIPAKGERFVGCPGFAEDRAREQTARRPFGGGAADARTWYADEEPYACHATGPKQPGPAARALRIPH